MAETELLNRMYHAILEWFVEHGRAPHYVELAHRLDLAAEETRRTLRELVDMGLPGVWQHPGTDCEGLSRWQCAGFSPSKKCASIVHALTAVNRFDCGCETASYSPLTRRA